LIRLTISMIKMLFTPYQTPYIKNTIKSANTSEAFSLLQTPQLNIWFRTFFRS